MTPDPEPYQQIGGQLTGGSETKTIRRRTADGTETMIRYVPRYEDRGWLRREYKMRGGSWEPVGMEIVEHLHASGFEN